MTVASSLFAQLKLADIHQDVARNIVASRQAQAWFDDLSEDPSDWIQAEALEASVNSPTYHSSTPLIDRPFEDAKWFNAIAWPFKHWQASRYSDGTYGVWYGSDSLETSVSESVYHWYTTLLTDASFTTEEVSIEREVYLVTCSAALLDLRAVSQTYSALLQATDYTFCQSVGARVQWEGHPGLLTQSVRRPQGENMVIFKPQVLSNPRLSCQLTYRLKGTQIAVEKEPGVPWLNLAVPSWSS